jgi:lipoprotein-releasing system permease protein
MKRYFTLFIASRYLFSKKSRNIINVITGISMATIMVVSAALIILLSAFNGLEQTVKDLFNAFDPSLQVTATQGKTIAVSEQQLNKIKSLKGIEHYSRIIEEHVLAIYDNKQQIILLKGVDDAYFDLVKMDDILIAGNTKLLHQVPDKVILGEGLASSMGINIMDFSIPLEVYYPKKGKININSPFNESVLIPQSVFSINHEYNQILAITSLEWAAELMGIEENEYSSLEIDIDDDADIDFIKTELKNILGNQVVIKDRYEQHQLMYRIMRSEKLAVFLIISFVLIIASFNIIGALSMLLVEKKKDMMVMWSMGSSFEKLKRIFILEGTLVSFIGGCIGILLGTILSLLQMSLGWIKLGNFEGAQPYPILFVWTDFILVFFTVIFIGFTASWIRMKSFLLDTAENRSLIK